MSGTNILSTGSLGLQVKNGVSTAVSINQAGAIVGTSCQINGVDVLTTAYKPFYAAGRVSSTGTKVSDTGRTSYTVTRPSAGIYDAVFATAYPNTNYVYTVSPVGAFASITMGAETSATKNPHIHIQE